MPGVRGPRAEELVVLLECRAVDDVEVLLQRHEIAESARQLRLTMATGPRKHQYQRPVGLQGEVAGYKSVSHVVRGKWVVWLGELSRTYWSNRFFSSRIAID